MNEGNTPKEEVVAMEKRAVEREAEAQWNKFRRTGLSELRVYVEGEDLDDVSVASVDEKNGSPKVGDMIARNPKNHDDQWLISEKYFADNLEPA